MIPFYQKLRDHLLDATSRHVLANLSGGFSEAFAYQSCGRGTGNCFICSPVSRSSEKSEMCLRPNVQETKEEAKVGPQRPGDDYFSGASNAKAIPFSQKKFGVHVRKPFPTLCVYVCVFLRHTQLGLSRPNENHVFLSSG